MFKISIIFIGLILSFSAFSDCALKDEKSACPYVGGNIKIIHANYKKGYGDNLLHHNVPQWSIYSGIKVIENVYLEAGYEHSIQRKKFRKLNSSDIVSGHPIHPLISTIYFASKLTLKGPYIDIIRLYPISLDKQSHLFFSSGVSLLKAKAERRAICVHPAAFPHYPLSGMARKLEGDKLILRISMGLQHMITDQLGFRAAAGWMNTSKLQVCSSDGVCALYYPEVRPRDIVNYSLGLFWAF